MKQKWKEEQFIELSMSELFVWWDWLDSLKDTPEKAFDLFTKFLEECEDQLEFNPEFLEKMEQLDKDKDFVEVDIDSIFDELPDAEYDLNNIEVFDESNKNARYKIDIPFSPRHDF